MIYRDPSNKSTKFFPVCLGASDIVVNIYVPTQSEALEIAEKIRLQIKKAKEVKRKQAAEKA